MPPKAAYRTFDEHPEIENDYYVAHQLGMTVARLRREMGNQERLEWSVYFARVRQRKELADLRRR